MARRGPASKRKIEADPVFRSVLVGQLINKILLKGKKEKARSIVYGAMEIVERRAGQDPLTVLKRAIDNLKPQLEVRSRRVVDRPIRCPLRYPRVGQTRWPSAGWSDMPASGKRTRWQSGWRTRFSTPATAQAPQ